MASVHWSKTEAALAAFKEELKCRICNHLADDPVKFACCGHCFCRGCVDMRNTFCASCGIPFRAVEVTADKNFHSLISGWKKIAAIVNEDRFCVDQPSKDCGNKNKILGPSKEPLGNTSQNSTALDMVSKKTGSKIRKNSDKTHKNQRQCEDSSDSEEDEINSRKKSLKSGRLSVLERSKSSDRTGKNQQQHKDSFDSEEEEVVSRKTSKSGRLSVEPAQSKSKFFAKGKDFVSTNKENADKRMRELQQLDASDLSEQDEFDTLKQKSADKICKGQPKGKGKPAAEEKDSDESGSSQEKMPRPRGRPRKSTSKIMKVDNFGRTPPNSKRNSVSKAQEEQEVAQKPAGLKNSEGNKKPNNSEKSGTPQSKVMEDDDDISFLTPVNTGVKIKTPKRPTSLKELMTRNKKGETNLHVACIKGDVAKLKSLLAAGANPNTKDNAGWTPLHDAVSQNFLGIIELLLDAEAFVDVPGVDNLTPLHEAVQSGKIDIVKLLVSRGANPMARTSAGKTAKDLAFSRALEEALQTPVLNHLTDSQNRPKLIMDKDPILCFHISDKEARKESASAALKLGLRVVSTFSADVTHLIVASDKNNVCSPSFEVFAAILCGCWIINQDWLSLSVESRQTVVDPAIFEIQGITDYVPAEGPKRGRLNSWKLLPGLFNGCHFFLLPSAEVKLGNCLLAKKELEFLIRYGGGIILSREPRPEDIPEKEKTVPYHAQPSSDLANTSHVILYGQNKDPVLKYNMVHIKTLPAEWLVGCIANWKLLDP